MAQKHSDPSRRFRRRTVRILVDYLGTHGVRRDYATTLGAGGLFIETEEPLPTDSRVKLRFRLSDEHATHEIDGCIVWIRKVNEGGRAHAPGMGVRFTKGVGMSALARDLEDFED